MDQLGHYFMKQCLRGSALEVYLDAAKNDPHEKGMHCRNGISALFLKYLSLGLASTSRLWKECNSFYLDQNKDPKSQIHEYLNKISSARSNGIKIDERDVAVRWIINAVSKCTLYRYRCLFAL